MENQTTSTISIKTSVFRKIVERIRLAEGGIYPVRQAERLIQLSDRFGGEYVNISTHLLGKLEAYLHIPESDSKTLGLLELNSLEDSTELSQVNPVDLPVGWTHKAFSTREQKRGGLRWLNPLRFLWKPR